MRWLDNFRYNREWVTYGRTAGVRATEFSGHLRVVLSRLYRYEDEVLRLTLRCSRQEQQILDHERERRELREALRRLSPEGLALVEKAEEQLRHGQN